MFLNVMRHSLTFLCNVRHSLTFWDVVSHFHAFSWFEKFSDLVGFSGELGGVIMSFERQLSHSDTSSLVLVVQKDFCTF